MKIISKAKAFGNMLLEEIVASMFETESLRVQARLDLLQKRIKHYDALHSNEVVATLKNTYYEDLNRLAPITRTVVYERYEKWIFEYGKVSE